MQENRNLSVHEIDITINIKFKVAVSDPDKQLAKYPDVMIQDIREMFTRTELLSSDIRLIGKGLTLAEAQTLCNEHLKV